MKEKKQSNYLDVSTAAYFFTKMISEALLIFVHDKAKLKRKTLIWIGRKQAILDSIQANTPHQTFGIKPKGHTFIFLFLVYKQNHLFFSKSW